MLSLVIFDCDGVMFDSWRANVGYYNAILERMGLPPLSADWQERVHVFSLGQVLDALFDGNDVAREEAQRTAKSIDYGPFYSLMEPANGLYDVLAQLQRSYHLAMATNRGATTRGVVRHFGLEKYLGLAVGAHDVVRPKPAPDMIEKCLRHFSVSSDHAVYVGDAPSDLEAAAAAGTHFIAVGDHSWASRKISSLSLLPDELTRLTGS